MNNRKENKGLSTPLTHREGQGGGSLYTLLVYSENVAGILNQITAVFTRRQVNIESLNGRHQVSLVYTNTPSQPGATKTRLTRSHAR